MEFPDHIVERIREQHSSLKVETRQLQLEFENVAKKEKFWAEFEKYLVQGWPLHILYLLENESPYLNKIRTENNPIVSTIEESYRIAKEESDRIIRRYPSYLEEAFKIAGLVLDPSSRHPKYSLESGFFRLEIDEKKRIVYLSDYEGKLAEHPADVQAVIDSVKREHQRIFGRPYSGQKFLKRLREQYKAVIRKENVSDGTSIPIRHITRRLGKNVKGFRTDEFLVDLSRLVEKGPLEIDGRKLDLQQTKNTNQGMLLYGAATRGYIGFIVFKEI